MAHLDPTFQHLAPTDRALLRAVCTWNALAISALALMLVAPALVISAQSRSRTASRNERADDSAAAGDDHSLDFAAASGDAHHS